MNIISIIDKRRHCLPCSTEEITEVKSYVRSVIDRIGVPEAVQLHEVFVYFLPEVQDVLTEESNKQA